MAHTVHRSIIIEATPAEIWPWLADAERELQWRGPQVVALEQLDDGPLRAGARFRGTAELLGDRATWVSEMTEIDAPRRMAWRAVETDAPAYAPGSYALEEVDGGTRMTITIDYEPASLKGRILLPLVTRLVIPRVIDGFLRQLRDLVEARDPAQTGG